MIIDSGGVGYFLKCSCLVFVECCTRMKSSFDRLNTIVGIWFGSVYEIILSSIQ